MHLFFCNKILFIFWWAVGLFFCLFIYKNLKIMLQRGLVNNELQDNVDIYSV
jgi:hypothetical protein